MAAGLIVALIYLWLGLLAVPAMVVLVQVLMAGRFIRDPVAPESDGRPAVAILVPAHNESAGIASFVAKLQPRLSRQDRLLIVADNCQDRTAELAAAAGAEVIIRKDNSRIGKGYALDFGIRHLAHDPPPVVIVVDADCEIMPGAIDHLARACVDSLRPAQATYTMRSPGNATLRMRIAEFAGIMKNLVRPLGNHRMGFPCMLMGTGMGFPWGVISRAQLATGHIVEDMKLGIDLARSGAPPRYCPAAEVVSYFPMSADGFAQQRSRWEHGHLGVILKDAPSLFLTALARRDRNLLAMALDLAVPPLALLTLLVWLASIAAAGVSFWLGTIVPLLFSLAILAMLVTGVIVAWHRYARVVVSGRELAFAPVYALLKVPLYLRFAYNRQKAWIRSRRDAD